MCFRRTLSLGVVEGRKVNILFIVLYDDPVDASVYGIHIDERHAAVCIDAVGETPDVRNEFEIALDQRDAVGMGLGGALTANCIALGVETLFLAFVLKIPGAFKPRAIKKDVIKKPLQRREVKHTADVKIKRPDSAKPSAGSTHRKIGS